MGESVAALCENSEQLGKVFAIGATIHSIEKLALHFANGGI